MTIKVGNSRRLDKVPAPRERGPCLSQTTGKLESAHLKISSATITVSHLRSVQLLQLPPDPQMCVPTNTQVLAAEVYE